MITPTARQAAAVYESLRAFPPFSRWKLPPADRVEFRVNRSRKNFGTYHKTASAHVITVSAHLIRHYSSFAVLMAHEMIHLYQQIRKTDTGAQHNRIYRRLAKRVCDSLGWDHGGFV